MTAEPGAGSSRRAAIAAQIQADTGIAESLELGITGARGILLGKGERLVSASVPL